MTILIIIILSFIQALTEFLPVSSSAHIALISNIVNIDAVQDKNELITIALHIGSLIAVLVFYKKELLKIVLLKNNKLLKKIIVAFLPIALVGAIITISSITIPKYNVLIGIMLIVFGILLYLVDKYKNSKKLIDNINTTQATIIGIFQILALIPGVSRSGITITAGRLLGLKREEAMKFSFLLLIPTIAASSLVLIYKILFNNFSNQVQQDLLISLLAIITSAIFSYIILNIFVKTINKFTFLPFIIYRIFIGIILLLVYVN